VRSGVGFGGVDPRVLFIPSCPGVTGLTGASPLWDLPRGTAVLMWCCPVFQLSSSWLVWSCLVRFCEGFSFLAGCCSVVVFVPGPRGVTEALRTLLCICCLPPA
jgi:hypothetical protein